jgi:hypothetical protein
LSSSWIVELRDAMIWRTRNFTALDAALAAWHHGPPPT